VCCSNHAIDLCTQHFVSTDRSVYNSCYHNAVDKCSSLCRANIDIAVGPNRQQLACAATAVRAVQEIKKQQKKYPPETPETGLQNTKELLNSGLASSAVSGGVKKSDESDATLNRFLSRQAARLETVNQ